MLKLKTKKDKIALLKGIEKGQRSIGEVIDFNAEFWQGDNCSDIMTNMSTGQELTKDQLQERRRVAPEQVIIWIEVQTLENQ